MRLGASETIEQEWRRHSVAEQAKRCVTPAAEVRMSIRYTHHARERMRDRRIESAWIEQTLLAPELDAPDTRNAPYWLAYRRIAEKGQRWLRVVYVPSSAGPLVVTAFFDRGMRRKPESGP